MKPAPFEYLAPATLEEALFVLSEHGSEAKILAGGQSLVPLLNFRLARPSLLVDLNRLAELSFVRIQDGELRLGAMTRQRQLEREPLVAEHAPLLHETAPWIAHPQIRNRGTIGGSLAHADPAAELPAVALAAGARFRLMSLAGERWVAAGDFYVGLLSTALAPEEMLVEVSVPRSRERCGWAFEEVARRHGDYAQVGVGAVVELDAGGRCTMARIGLLSVADVPQLAAGAARCIEGEIPSAASIEAAAAAAREGIDPSDDIHASAAFKRHLAGVLTRRVLETALARAAGKQENRG
jgi:CO/xanthine dehydrogenase FAD-binding subunit